MKKAITAAMVIACLITTIFLLTSPLTFYDQSVKAHNGNNPENIGVTPSDAVDSQTSAAQSEPQNEGNTPSVNQNQQTPCRDQSSAINQTVSNQIAQPATPLPDGRIFLHATNGTDDAIPYIPTQYAKTTTPPIIPSELGI